MAKKTNEVEDTNVFTNDGVDDTVVFTPEVTELTETQHVVPEAPEQPKVEAKKNSKVDTELNRLVEETLRGQHGSGRERMLSLGNRYVEVQQEVNRRSR